ncbi:MAG: hypothetical protein IPM63_07850 [Acidobacteriota bacterium]|nr:MAG: hypothetical protein IPM63_07850 [Acidobacteriota bacterium]
MRITAVLLSVLILSAALPAQDPTPTASPEGTAAESQADQDKYEFQAAVKLSDPAERSNALVAFAEKYPESELVAQAREYATAARAEMAAKAIEAGDNEEGVRLFRLAVSEAPEPVSDKLYTGVLLQIPNNLFFSGLREASFELASMIEKKVGSDAKKLLGLATFHLAVENSADSRRLAEMAIELEPELPTAYQTLGLAHRLGFELEASEAAYVKALELDPESNVSRRSLAEIKRALGKPEEAIALYDAVIASEPSDSNAGTGRTLALFDAGRVSEAESSLETLLSVSPKNMVLLAGAAYWYAANGDSQKAVEYANRALAVEPRYTWSYIALAKGLMAAGRPLEAERVLLSALRFGSFPTLYYQIAAARLKAGFYREAAEAIANSFSVVDGRVKTRLGGRVERTADSLNELISPERQASIFQPRSADDASVAEALKKLLRFSTAVAAGTSPDIVSEAADSFVAGADPMRTHRLIFAATLLIEKEIALQKASELVRGAVGTVEDSLAIELPEAAVLADEMYASRRVAMTQGSTIVVPEVPKQTLERILRGRIEELEGWAAYKQGNNDEALVHLKRAASIVPADSAWYRSVYWRLGIVFETMNRDKEALENYLVSYRSGEQTEERKAVIEKVYVRLNGDKEGLDQQLSGETVRTEAASMFLKQPEETKKNEDAPVSVPETNPEEGDDLQVSIDEQNIDAKPKDEPAREVSDSAVSSTPAVNPLPEDVERANREAMEAIDLNAPLKPVERPSGSSDAPKETKSGSDKPPSEVTGGSGDLAGKRSRPRIVPESPDRPSENTGTSEPKCTVVLSQDSVSIAAGGSTGVLAGLEGVTGAFRLRAISSSPDDVNVVVDRTLEALVGRAMFLISSVSRKPGVFSVTFESSCGTRDLQVTVR